MVSVPAGTPTEVRDGVGIDRVHGVAATGIKYDRAVLPRGTSLKLEIAVEIPPKGDSAQLGSDRVRAMVGHLVAALEAGEIRFGAARTRGLGRVRLTEVKVLDQDLGTRGGMLAFLQRQGQAVSPEALRKADSSLMRRRPPHLKVEIDWQPIGPVMVKGGYDGIAVDLLPLVSGKDGQLALVLPGSAIKGPLRSHAERIVRTLLGRDAIGDQNDRQRFLRQVEEPLVRSLFGSAGEGEDDEERSDDEGRNDDPLPGRGALAATDCYANHEVSSAQWARVESAVDDRSLRRELDRSGFNTWAEAYHVAVDRWTGGAADGFLYNVLEPHGVRWGPIVLTVDLSRLTEGERLPALALLFLLLRDFSEGRIPLGFGANRGLAWLSVQRISIEGDGLEFVDPRLAGLNNASLDKGSLSGLDAGALGAVSDAWERWIQAHAPEARR